MVIPRRCETCGVPRAATERTNEVWSAGRNLELCLPKWFFSFHLKRQIYRTLFPMIVLLISDPFLPSFLPSVRVTAMAPPSLRTFLDLLRLFHRYQYTAEAELANGAVIHLLDLNAVSGTDRHTVHRTNLRLGRQQQQTHGRNFLSSPLTRHE